MKPAKLLQLFVIIFVFSNLLLAQTAPSVENGFKSFGSYQGGDLDTVNLQTGNLMFHVPLFSYPQRGGKLDASYILRGSSKSWQVGEWTDNQNVTHQKWVLGQPAGVALVDPSGFEVHRNRHLTTDFAGNQTYSIDDYAVVTGDGSWHWLSGSTPSGQMITMDGSGIQLVLTPGIKTDHSDDTATVITRDGTHYPFPNISVPMPATGQGNNLAGVYIHPELVLDAWGTTQTAFDASGTDNRTDANGNSMGAFATDTLGHNITGSSVSTSDYSGCVTTRSITGASISSFPGPDGRLSTVKVCVTSFTPTAAFSQPNVDPPSVPSVPWQLNSYSQGVGFFIGSIVMPDGNHWSFDFDNFGNVTKITLPTGGTISYQWTEIPDTCADGSLTRVSRAVSSRTVNDLSTSQSWNYTWGQVQQDGSITNYVLDPNGNDTAHVFRSVTSLPCDFYEVETRSYHGTHAGGTVVHTVDKHYVAAFGFSATSTFPANVVPDVITNTLSNGRISKVVRQYDGGGSNMVTYGNVADEKIYDYGNGGPGALLRETATTYQWQANSAYLDAGFLDLPASVVIKDGSGCALSETDYIYDEANYLTAYSGTLPTGTHQAAPGGTVRGNLTTVKKWLAATSSCNPLGGTAVTSHVKWYDTGVPYQTIDPLGHTTTFSYDSAYAGAYVSQTCSPQTATVTHCVSGTYDFVTGLLESLSNENATTVASGNTPGDAAHTSNYAYDTSWRLTSAQAPPDPANSSARSTTSFTPSAANAFPLSVQHQRSITTALTDSSTAYVDGLARITKTTHTLPNGTATVLTTYDGVGQPVSVTNPYFTTADPTYGVTSSLYDALGRAYNTTRQDGSISGVAYNAATTIAVNGDCTIFTDEAGKQRGTCADALGRLVEADEPNSGVTVQVNYHATMQQDGSFQVYNPAGTSLWSTGTAGTNAGSIFMQDDGNLVLYIFKWQAGVYAAPSPGPFTPQSCSISSYLVAGQRINPNQCIVSPHGQYMLYMAPYGNLFIYDIAHSVGTWGTNTNSAGAYAILQTDGNLVVYATNGVALWNSGTSGTFAERLDMEDDGRIIIYKSAWNSGTSDGQFNGTVLAHPGCDVGIGTGWTGVLGSGQCFVSPNGRFELLLQGDGNLVIYDRSVTPNASLWSSRTAVSPADPGFAMRTLYAYDALGNLLRVDQKGTAPSDSTQWRTRTFTYDSLSRLLTATNPESGTITYSYDADGELLQKTSPAPNQTGSLTQTVSYCYDELHRITKRDYQSHVFSPPVCPITAPVATYAYDSGTNAIGHLTSLTDQAGTASYTYDILGRLASETRSITGASKSTSYTYNLDGSVKTLTYPSGRVVTYTPDSAGRLVSAMDGNGTNYVTSASYNPDSSMKSLLNGSTPALNQNFQYTPRLQLCRITTLTSGTLPTSCSDSQHIGNIMDRGYDFHAGNGTAGSGTDNGNVFAITNYRDANRSQAFTYDALNRLASGSSSANTGSFSWGENYSIDAWGNLQISPMSGKAHGGNFTLSGNAQNRPTGLAYDAAGNLTSYLSSAYVYDQENRLSAAAGVSYTYDGNGERVLKSNTSTGAAVKRYWSMGGNTLAEGDGSGNLTAEYIYFGGKRVARIDLPANTVHYYLSDHLGSTSIVATATGTVEEESDYYPFGTEVVVTSGQNHYKFTGKERDTETNVDYFGARYYTSNMGRWMNPDQPFADQNPADPQSWNLYEYARNNPLRNIDIDGFKVLEAVVAQARAQIAATAAAGEDTFTMVFLGVNSGVDASTGLARSTLTGDSIGQWSNEFGLGNLDTSASGNTVLLPNDSNAVSAFIGSANQDQIDTANAIAPLVSDAGLSMDGISHSNGVNALGAVAAGGVKFDSTVVIAPNTSSTNTMSNIVNASQGTTIISSPNDSRLAETPAHKSPPAWQRIFGKDPKVNVQQTDQKGHGAQCYAAEIHGQDSTSVGGCK